MQDKKPTKEEIIKMMDDMIARYEELPDRAMMTAINHYDFLTFMYLVRSAVTSQNKSDD
jgi:hypothetical protein